MQAQEEIIQIIDQYTGEPTGELATRKELFEKKLWCRTTNVFILNPEGLILCHQRTKNKERFPGAWSTHFGGHVGKDESFKISALKEIKEETGLSINPFQLIPWRTSKKDISRIWIRDFLTVFDGPAESLQIQKEEIDKVEWLQIDEILAQLED